MISFPNILQNECVAPANSHSDERDCQFAGAEVSNGTSGNSENWMVLSIAGDKPMPRFNVRCYYNIRTCMLSRRLIILTHVFTRMLKIKTSIF